MSSKIKIKAKSFLNQIQKVYNSPEEKMQKLLLEIEHDKNLNNSFQRKISKKYPLIEFQLWFTKHTIILAKIVLPIEKRGKGIGSKILEEIKIFAKKVNKIIILTSSTILGAKSQRALDNFYFKNGFKKITKRVLNKYEFYIGNNNFYYDWR